MENFSTTRVGMLPRAANLVTLVVVVTATWWSGAQRPAGQAVLATAEAVPTAAQANTSVQGQPATLTAAAALTSTSAITAGATSATTWPAQAATTLARDGLQAVGYQTRTQR